MYLLKKLMMRHLRIKRMGLIFEDLKAEMCINCYAVKLLRSFHSHQSKLIFVEINICRMDLVNAEYCLNVCSLEAYICANHNNILLAADIIEAASFLEK